MNFVYEINGLRRTAMAMELVNDKIAREKAKKICK